MNAMNPYSSWSRLFVALSFLALLGPLAQAETSNKWRIKFDHSANEPGIILFKVTNLAGAPIEVAVSIPQGAKENAVAKEVENAFKMALPKDEFHVERDDFEDVLIKKHLGTDNFGLEVISNTASGLKVKLHKE